MIRSRIDERIEKGNSKYECFKVIRICCEVNQFFIISFMLTLIIFLFVFDRMGKENLSCWKSLPESLRCEIKNKFLLGCAYGKGMNYSTIGAFLTGFKNAGYQWVDEVEIRNAIFRKIGELSRKQKDEVSITVKANTARSLSNIIYCCGHARVKREMVPTEVFLGLLEAIKHHSPYWNEQNISNLLFG